MKTLAFIILTALLDIVPGGKAFLNQLQPRDSVLIADQLEYGFRLDAVPDGTLFRLPDFSEASNDTLTLVRSWQLDTLKTNKKAKTRDIRAAVILAPFEAGIYELPQLSAERTFDGKVDTLVFEVPEPVEVTTFPIDTLTYVPHDIKGQIRYPVTFMEVLPWLLGTLVLALLVFLAVRAIRRARERASGVAAHKDPPYVVALRKLDHWRGDKHWAPEKQKAFYSGVTDILKEYIDSRFGIDAPEMTTAELFDALKGEKDLTPETYTALKDLFERADFVKFAKMVVSDAENATVLPLAVKFVTDTYQSELEEEQGQA